MGQILSFKAWLVENNIRQTEVAKVLNISLQSVNMKVNGKKDFTLAQVKRLCEHYHLSADIFLPKELQYSNKGVS